MKIMIAVAAAACACAAAAAVLSGADPSASSGGQKCAVRAQGIYGFQCHGSVSTGGPLEPVTYVAVVEGYRDGFFEGSGTFNSSQGSASTHLSGYATFGKSCFGRVTYSTNEIVLPDGSRIPLPPLVIDFVPVDDFHEILGAPVAGPGVNGDVVPRLVCRLMRQRSD